jgi:hypothetical protein
VVAGSARLGAYCAEALDVPDLDGRGCAEEVGDQLQLGRVTAGGDHVTGLREVGRDQFVASTRGLPLTLTRLLRRSAGCGDRVRWPRRSRRSSIAVTLPIEQACQFTTSNSIFEKHHRRERLGILDRQVI